MITERNQGAEKTFTADTSNASVHRGQRFFGKWLRVPVRHGVSKHVLKTAKGLMQEYQEDLDYLRDH